MYFRAICSLRTGQSKLVNCHIALKAIFYLLNESPENPNSTFTQNNTCSFSKGFFNDNLQGIFIWTKYS